MKETKPSRPLGFWMCTALVVGNMIGSGVYLLPAALAPFGWNSVFGWLLTIAGGLCLAFVFAQLSRALPKAGGPYAYAREAFGPAPAFLVAWAYWISIWVGNAAVVTGSVSYLSVFFPDIATSQGLPAIIAVAAIWILTAVNLRGASAAGGVQLVTTIIKVIPLVAVIVLAVVVFFGLGGNARVAPPPLVVSDLGFAGVTAAATLTLWALLGIESATVPAEKVDDPTRTIPRATMAGMAIAGVLYLFTCSAVVLLLPATELAASAAPFTDFVARYFDPRAGVLIAAFAAISG
ncbi:MAG: amino acid permease, partial [Parvularculaceae bacterium]